MLQYSRLRSTQQSVLPKQFFVLKRYNRSTLPCSTNSLTMKITADVIQCKMQLAKVGSPFSSLENETLLLCITLFPYSEGSATLTYLKEDYGSPSAFQTSRTNRRMHLDTTSASWHSSKSNETVSWVLSTLEFRCVPQVVKVRTAHWVLDLV